MKRCPECRRDYTDETLNFCLDDGAALLDGPAMIDEQATAILPGSPDSGGVGLGSEAETREQIHATEKTATSPTGIAAAQHSKNFDRRLLLAPLALIVLGGFFGYRYFSATRQIESIAVMPFINESGNADLEYLSDGMTETLLNKLSQLPNLSVKARSSVFRYKGTQWDTKQIGSELGVQAILNGRVLQRAEDLILYLELVDARDGTRIWGDQYNRRQTDLAALQQEIARDVSDKLRKKLSGPDRQRLANNHTVDSGAFQLYLKGRFYWNKRTKEGIEKATDFFQQAIEADPSYPLAYVGLADAYNFLGAFGIAAMPPQDAMPRAKAAAARALEIDDSLAEAHASLAFAQLYYDRDWAAAEAEFQKSIQLNPNYTPAYQWYSHLLMARGRSEESIAQAKRAVEIDPLSLPTLLNLGWQYHWMRQPDLAIETLRKLTEMDPNFVQGRWGLGLAYEQKGLFPEAIAEFEQAVKLSDEAPVYLASLAHALGAAGRKAEAKEILESLEKRSAADYIPPYWVATVYAGLGEKDAAFEWLDKAFAEHSGGLVWLTADPRMDPLRSEPRFKDLLRRVGLHQ